MPEFKPEYFQPKTFEPEVFKFNTRLQIFDSATREWFDQHPDAQTTVTHCEKCGLFYKPSLEHKCKKGV